MTKTTKRFDEETLAALALALDTWAGYRLSAGRHSTL